MNRELIKEIRDDIAQDHAIYSQRTYGHAVVFDYKGKWKKNISSKIACNTPCCIAGLALLKIPLTDKESELMRTENFDLEAVAQKRLQFPENLAQWIFAASWPDAFFMGKGTGTSEVPTPQQAVEFLDALLDGKFDQWDIWDGVDSY